MLEFKLNSIYFQHFSKLKYQIIIIFYVQCDFHIAVSMILSFFSPHSLPGTSLHLSVCLCLPVIPICLWSFSISSPCALNHFSPRVHLKWFFLTLRQVFRHWQSSRLPASDEQCPAQVVVSVTRHLLGAGLFYSSPCTILHERIFLDQSCFL